MARRGAHGPAEVGSGDQSWLVMAKHGVAWRGAARCGAARGAVRWSAIRSGLVRCCALKCVALLLPHLNHASLTGEVIEIACGIEVEVSGGRDPDVLWGGLGRWVRWVGGWVGEYDVARVMWVMGCGLWVVGCGGHALRWHVRPPCMAPSIACHVLTFLRPASQFS